VKSGTPEFGAPVEASLIVVGGKASRSKVALKLPTLIGRSREAGLTVGHPMVSRRHCEVFEVDGLLMIRDLGSLNGTLVDGRRIKESPLLPDAQFTVGPLTFRADYQYDGDLSKLPAVVLAEQDTTVSPIAAEAETPDLAVADEPAEETSPAPVPTEKPVEATTLLEKPEAASESKSEDAPLGSPGDAFDDFLNELG
jgi:predicted component of type VI protein secretion system